MRGHAAIRETSRAECRPSARAFGLLELILALALMTVLLAGLSSVLVLSTRSLEGAVDHLTDAQAAQVLESIGEDARLATLVVQHTAESFTITVPDRDEPPDGKGETIRYVWQGSNGSPGPLVRQYNNGDETSVLDSVRDFQFNTVTRTAKPKPEPPAPAPDSTTWGYFTTQVPEANPPWIATGSYTGDGTDDRAFDGLEFAPDVVIIKGEVAGQTAVIRTSTVLGDAAKSMGGGATMLPNRIQSLDADGFTIGSHAQVNEIGRPFYWTAMRDAEDFVKVGTYDGNGVDGRSIPGVGFRPDYVIVFGENGRKAWQRSLEMTGDTSHVFREESSATNRIQALELTGFQVGSSDHVNGDGVPYHYVCLRTKEDKVAVGSYVGDDTDGRPVLGLGFRPDYVLVKADAATEGAHRPASAGRGDVTLNFNGSVGFADGIQRFRPDGFEVGADGRVNRSGTKYYWTAFSGRPSPLDFEAMSESKLPLNDRMIKINLPPGTSPGDLLIAAVVTDGGEDITPVESWDEIAHDDQFARVTLGVWWKIAKAGDPAVQAFTWSSDEQAYGWIMRFTGHDPADPIHRVATRGGNDTTPRCAAVTTSVDGALILRIGGFDDSDITEDEPGLARHASITMDASNTGASVCSGGAGFYLQGAAGTTDSPEFQLISNEDYRTVTIAIAPQP